jgi:hypothetical protein
MNIREIPSRARLPGVVLVASLPMLGAAAGAWLDERLRLGFTNWRSACRAAGPGLATLADFTLQLLPLAVMGLLIGGLAVLLVGVATRHRREQAGACLAAHAGCALTIPLALLICASSLPLPLMLLADLTITALAALWLLRLMRPASRAVASHP